MQAVILFFWQMLLLRRKPQDLPPSVPLTAILLLANVLVGSFGGVELFGNVLSALGANTLDAALLAVLLFVALRLRGHGERWLQTFTAYLGVGTMVSAIMVLYRPPLELLGLQEFGGLLNLILVLWIHVVFGHVLRHAIQVPLGLGVLVAFVYTLFSLRVVSYYFPMVQA